MNFKLNDVAINNLKQTVDPSLVQNTLKQIDEETSAIIKKYFSDESVAHLSKVLQSYLRQALEVRTKILAIEKIIQQQKTRGKKQVFQQQKNYTILTEYLKQGYKLVMKLREYVTKEKMGYAIKVSSSKESMLAVYSIDEMLDMATLVQSEKSFALALKNVEGINRQIQQMQTNMQYQTNQDRFQQTLNIYNTIFKNIIKYRKEVIQGTRVQPEGEKAITSIYYRGLGGFILEKGISISDKNLSEQELINITSVTGDTDRYSSGGDLQGDEVPEWIKQVYGYSNLEVKNIGELGAGLVNLTTVIRDLNKIIEILKNPNIQQVNTELEKEIFRNKKHVAAIKPELENELNNVVSELTQILLLKK